MAPPVLRAVTVIGIITGRSTVAFLSVDPEQGCETSAESLCLSRGHPAHPVSRNFPDYSFALDTALYRRRHFKLSAPQESIIKKKTFFFW